MSWRRPYGVLVDSVVWLLVEFVVPPALAFEEIAWFTRPSRPVVTVVAIGCLAFLIPLAVRASLLGVYVSPSGLRVRRMLHTETVSWADVTGIDDRPAMIGAVDLDRDMLVVTARGGRVLGSSIQRGSIEYRRSTPRFVNLTVWKPLAAGQLVVAPAGYDGIKQILRDRLARENPAPAPPPIPARSRADAAVLARKRARGEFG